MVTWRMETDHLRCNPSFHHKPRYDYVILNTEDKPIFGQLILVFSITIGKIKYPLTLVQPFDALVEPKEKDKVAGLYRLQIQQRDKSEIFSVASIICGAVLVKDFDEEDEYLIMDILDSDMFLRIKALDL